MQDATSATDRPNEADGRADFDFEFGRWNVSHRRLRRRLAGDDNWEVFSGTSEAWPTLGGLGNIEDNFLDLPGAAYRAMAVRTFDPAERSWSIWWLDGRNPTALDVPVLGRFEGGVGTFVADDSFEGRAIKVRFIWSGISAASARWEQAFSSDGGSTWETNWTMDFLRVTG